MAHDCGDSGGHRKLLPLQGALDAYAERIRPLAAERGPVHECLGRVLAEPAASSVDLPLFTQGAVDGYALRSTDATQPLRVTGEIAAGDAGGLSVGPGEALRIFTGGALPAGADTVARQEIVQRDGDTIRLTESLGAGVDTRYRGEEIREGDPISPAGRRLHSGLLAALAMAGVQQVSTRPRPRVAVLVTGNEVAQPGQALAPGQIHDANGPLCHGWLAERGYPLALLRYVPDSLDAVTAALQDAAACADLVITSGGVSVGDHDHLPAAAQAAGFERVFWKVAQKPGKPIWYGMRDNQPLLALPGNPGAVLIGLHVHVIRALQLLEGADEPAPLWREGALAVDFKADRQRDSLLRVTVGQDESGRVVLGRLGKQDSHMLSNLARADALAWLPASEGPLLAGTRVRWISLGSA
ncbi:molybdopterin molybdenumtransferase MoeA [Solimonas sp. K1W22B-7]|uniref:molybdopterin molybdotransferase MoeA n=1 Tax=Solimonas sp. K1W22B-7 TaxID=2303331 RepID=UPI000E337C83|nr:molybdopterin molybdotransferase MoeA [Solimonas sp. K1W22B-7]AXQ28402.1 molybdopterin molybdenumtransferase MoeA [Solimonas sp. K1W22B-7]